MSDHHKPIRKIIHIDMDCFFAAIEMRDHPELKNQPIAVGGTPQNRGVLATCNYLARKYGLHSAMPAAIALKRCPRLIIIPPNMEKYRKVAKILLRIFKQYTPLVEPLSLDEAFLDVTNCSYCKNSATLIAKTIKARIKKELQLTASAGIASNKFLAKIASDWRKPDGLFVITPEQIDAFVERLPVNKIFGVGKVTAATMHSMNIKNCADLQKVSRSELTEKFGKRGSQLYNLCRGIDDRPVETEYTRKSLSVEITFSQDLRTIDECLAQFPDLFVRLSKRLEYNEDLAIHKQFVKIKFHDFKQTTAETIVTELTENLFIELLKSRLKQNAKPVRLLGIGIRFK